MTVGAAGTLRSRPAAEHLFVRVRRSVTIDIQRLTLAGLPDGKLMIASGVSFNSNFNAITVSPAFDLPIDARFAFIELADGVR